MFAFVKLSLLALVLPLVHALTIDAPTDAVSTQQSTITFSGSGDDPSFTIELNHPEFRNALAIANNVNPGDGSLVVTWPILLQTTGFTLTAVNLTNINDVFATSGSFNIAPAPSFSASGTPSTVSASGSATNPPSLPAPSSTSPSTNSRSSSTQTGPSSSSSSAAPTQINGGGDNGAYSNKANAAAVVFAALGAAVFAL